MTVLDDINSIRKEVRENFSKVPLVEEFQSFYVHVETLLNLAENRLNSDYALLSSDQEQRNLLTYFQNLNFNIANELIKSNGTQWNSTLTASKHIFQIVRKDNSQLLNIS